MEDHESIERLLVALRERAKELNCLYQVEELFSRGDIALPDIFRGIVQAMPAGWQYADICEARIVYLAATFQSPGFRETPWMQNADIVVQEEVLGVISVCYTDERPAADEGPFLKEERKLLNTISERVARRILHENLKTVFQREGRVETPEREWRVILDLLRRTDPKLLMRVTRKMLNQLSWAGIEAADKVLEAFSPAARGDRSLSAIEDNRPVQFTIRGDLLVMSDEIFGIAAAHVSGHEILTNIQKWIQEDRSGFLVRILESPTSSLAEIASAIERFHHLSPQGLELSSPRERGFRVSLIRRMLSDHPRFINIAKRYIHVSDFYELLHRVIAPAGSHGRMGGKGAGLLLAAKVLAGGREDDPTVPAVKVPKTWYLTSDGLLNFINYNDLEEIVEQKYEEVGHVRHEYPYIVHLFKNSPLPPEIVNGLSVALDDFGERPLIVRSSSLLEDRMGTSFAGKYKSLFIANQGSKRDRLVALMDAITEVYASTFGPDPIEYRIEHDLVDFHEEMGILIQEVVGTHVGRYFLPAFAGVGFTNNELRWSRRIRREDGLLRMVPGLGTRAVDRVSDDYPILLAPGQPALRVNVTIDEKVRYAPQKIDVINLETNTFETIVIADLLREYGSEYPILRQLVSIARDDRLEQVTALGFEPDRDHLVVTFEGLITRTPLVEEMKAILRVLQSEFHSPVDIEFAHDGVDLYLLQCRPQSYGRRSQPAAIPHDLPAETTVFTANRYVSNGTVSDITHIVYVDPQRYTEITERADLLAVGRAVSRLNQLLPKRQFILMGPGRWGSRDDIRLGVNVTYSDINNTAMLIEIARKRRDYVPELSFGTHFFQDLVEASIRYLPLYPDDHGIQFNEAFLTQSRNALPELLPEFSHLANAIRVIDVPGAAEGRLLQILMNGETDEAVAVLVEPSVDSGESPLALAGPEPLAKNDDRHWRWRLRMADRLASLVDPDRFGVKALYLFGSTKNATAGPQSDIDLLVHFVGTEDQRRDLMSWLEGWSLSLSQMNYLRTGHKTLGLLDVHIITDSDLEQRTSYASKIGATTDAARPLRLGERKLR